MGRAYKNFWSLNTDEAVVTGILRSELGRNNVEILMPLNAQMKDVDLVVINIRNKSTITIQVKGSRAYEPKKKELDKFKEGSGGWFFFQSSVINNSKADLFIFLVYVLEESKEAGRRHIKPHILTIPTNVLKEKVKKNRLYSGDRYKFFFWVKPRAKEVFDTYDKDKEYSEFLNERGIDLLKRELKI